MIGLGRESRLANELRRRDRQELGFDPAMKIRNVLENRLLGLIDRAHGGEQRDALLRLLPLGELPLFHRQARSLRLRPASLVDDLRQHQNPDVDRSLVVAQMLLDAIDVQTRDLVDGLVEVDDARCAIDVLELNRQRAALIRLEGNPERLFETGEMPQVQPVGLLAFSGRWDLDHRFELAAPCAKMRDTVGSADYADPDLAALLRLGVRSIQEQSVLGKRTALRKRKL